VFRQVHRQLSGIALYPFSRADRLELQGGIHTISYDLDSTSREYSSETRQLLHESSVSRPAAPAVHLVETGAAFVRDTSVAGPTSPILGARYRFGVSPTFGSLTTATVVADVRKYVMPVRPFTIAMRLQHFARVGSDAWDPRMTPLVWTLRDLVRGYGDTLDTS